MYNYFLKCRDSVQVAIMTRLFLDLVALAVKPMNNGAVLLVSVVQYNESCQFLDLVTINMSGTIGTLAL